MDKTISAPLWTKDFTIITLGSAVSMLGNAMAGFSISLFVLDFTGSASLYALYLFLQTFPQIAAPVLAGPLMDRFSRRRTIYFLDFCSAALYGAAGLLIVLEHFNFFILAVMTLFIGTIQSVYQVAFQSFYPLLVSPVNYEKAYSVSGTLETLSYVTIAVAAFFYQTFGIAAVLGADSLCFFIAALFETNIGNVEASCPREMEKSYRLKDWQTDCREGFRYLHRERGLLCIATWFMISSMAGGASSVITLPWFRGNFPLGEYVYMAVWGFMVIGRVLGCFLQYHIQIPVKKRYPVALTGFVLVALIESVYLFTPRPAMCVLCFLVGILGAATNNIRVSAIQSHVPDDRKGRFNGAFLMMATIGTLSGELLAGAAVTVLPLRSVMACFMILSAVAALVLIGGGRRYAAPVLNREA